MKLAFNTIACPDWTLAQIARNARALGFQGVQISVHRDGIHLHPDTPAGEARAIESIFRDAGVAIYGLWAYTSFVHADDAQVVKNQEELRKLIGLGEALGARTIRTYGGALPAGASREVMDQKMSDALRPLAREAHERGLRIGLYTHDEWVTGKRNHEMVERVGSPGFGTVYDVYAAYLRSGEPWEETYRQIRDHLCYTLLADGYYDQNHKHHHAFPGAGSMPVNEIVAALKSGGYGTCLSFNWEKKWDRSLEEPERALPRFRDWIRQVGQIAHARSPAQEMQ